MYSRIPMPRMDWTEERMRYALCFFPLIGAVIGAVEIATFALCEILGAGVLFRTCLLTAVPLLITGGIHMDGYLDVTDARHSYGEREKKLAILKDPHTGAFAIIGLGLYLLLYAGAVSELVGADVWLLPGALMLERACYVSFLYFYIRPVKFLRSLIRIHLGKLRYFHFRIPLQNLSEPLNIILCSHQSDF